MDPSGSIRSFPGNPYRIHTNPHKCVRISFNESISRAQWHCFFLKIACPIFSFLHFQCTCRRDIESTSLENVCSFCSFFLEILKHRGIKEDSWKKKKGVGFIGRGGAARRVVHRGAVGRDGEEGAAHGARRAGAGRAPERRGAAHGEAAGPRRGEGGRLG